MLKSAGHFFNMEKRLTDKKTCFADKERFEKQCSLPADLIPLLKSRGLSIADDRLAVDYLSHIGYLLGYVSPANTFTQKLKTLFDKYNPDPAAMGFPADWETEPVWKNR